MTRRDHVVKVADLKVGGAGDVLVALGLGSCVAIILHDPVAAVGGMAHVLLPTPSLAARGANPHKFPQSAVPALLEEMTQLGANPRRCTARLAGGAAMFAALMPTGTIQMGERNIVSSRKVVHAHAIPIIGEAVGGTVGRTVRFDIARGIVDVSTVQGGVQQL